ncbi:hypothetical protein CASFOL_015793 [Castilleja foliolosa]|uniref:F-box domain-containing protein n=1 Tax=Castilleja foliolosa TaxID=1961234 RepID=A0ABD3DJ09_9LAMI
MVGGVVHQLHHLLSFVQVYFQQFHLDFKVTTKYMGKWADLPPELLDIILSKVFAKDRFGLVCRSWNAAVVNSPYPCSVPCMMYYYRRMRTWKFYLNNSSFFTSFPQLNDSEIHCSKHGWLLMARNNNDLFFFNPSNNQTLNLPCANGFKYDRVFFFHPPTSPDCIVVGINTRSWKAVEICMLKHGEYEWERFEFPTYTEYSVSHAPPFLHHGQIYFLDLKGDVARFNIINRSLVISRKCLSQRRDRTVEEHYLFKVKGEEALFGVFVFNEERDQVEVFRLSEGLSKNTTMKWALEEGIGDSVLYLSHASCFVCTAKTKTMGNRIYFPLFRGDSPVFYSLSDKKYHSLDGDYSSNNTYGLKRLDFAAWVTPSLITTTSELTETELRWTSPPQVD